MTRRNDAENPPLRLGVVGMSEGNGHPYSWSAIFNGYDPDRMAACPFPVIPKYLAERRFPEDSLGHLARVTHVFTEDPAQARDIAAASRVEHVCARLEDLIGAVDAVLLARDDAEQHRRFAAPLLAAGLPVFIDKPLALSVREAEDLLALQRYEGQIFSCSSLRYAPELQITRADLDAIGPVRLIEATTPKRWATYAAHALEPIVAAFADTWGCPFPIRSRAVVHAGDLRRLTMTLDGDVLISVTSVGSLSAPIALRIYGEQGARDYVFRDSFTAFRGSLEAFVGAVRQRAVVIPRAQTLEVVRCIERGQRPHGSA